MDISVIKELKEFEDKNKDSLDQQKKLFIDKLKEKKKEILEKNEMELYELSLNKHNIIKQAKAKAKNQALETISEFKEKTQKLEKSSAAKIDEAINIIFQEFLDQNV